MSNPRTKRTLFLLLSLALCLPPLRAAEPRTIAGQPIDPKHYKGLLDNGYLPLRPELTDRELAGKLDLDLPALAGVKAAVAADDPAGLRKALADYLDSRLPPRRYPPTGKPPRNREQADRWLREELVWGDGTRYPLGDRVNWWHSLAPGGYADGGPDLAGWGSWLHPLENAYADSGDPKYAETILRYARSFYHQARPVAKADWGERQFLGPWHSLSASGRIMDGYAPSAYRTVGRYAGTTDADRILFLKLFWETADYCYRVLAVHKEHNFEVHVVSGLLNMAEKFPEFRDRGRWLERCSERVAENLRDTVTDDGGSFERTGYHYAYELSYADLFGRLRRAGAPLPASFARGLERMFEWSEWNQAPTLEYPLFGTSHLGPMDASMERAAGLFPGRADFAYLHSGGKTGRPPAGVARVFPQTGRLTMRSGWSRDALFLALNYNGSHAEVHSDGTWANLLSFALWAHGRPWLTDSGTTAAYSQAEFRDWCMHTRSNNTVLVDGACQDHVTNGGRLERWASLPDAGPGSTYLSAVSRAYQKLGVEHRRSVLFLRPDYWLVHDVLTGDGKPHDYSWQAHFQPATLTVDPRTRSVVAAAPDGKRLWLVAAEPNSFMLEQKMGPIITRDADPKVEQPLHPHRKLAPYVLLTRRAVKEPTTYTVVLAPAEAGAPVPTVETLEARQGERRLPRAEAAGYRVRRGRQEDLVAFAGGLTLGSGPVRQYGPAESGLRTDGEAACVRLDGGRLAAGLLVAGRRLDHGGRTLLTAGPDVEAVHFRYKGDRVEVAAQGRGKVSLWAGAARQVVCEDRPVPARLDGGRLVFRVGRPGELRLTRPVFANDPQSLLRAIGLPPNRAEALRNDSCKDSVVVRWETAEASSAAVEYRAEDGGPWWRTVVPGPATEHRVVLRPLIPGKTYQFRVLCRTPDGQVGRLEYRGAPLR